MPPNPLTPEQYAKKLGVSRKRFLELMAIADKALAETAAKRAAELGLTLPQFYEYVRTPLGSGAAGEAGNFSARKVQRKSDDKHLRGRGTSPRDTQQKSTKPN